MWLAAIVLAYLGLSLLAALTLYCAAAMAHTPGHDSDEERVRQRPYELTAGSSTFLIGVRSETTSAPGDMNTIPSDGLSRDLGIEHHSRCKHLDGVDLRLRHRLELVNMNIDASPGMQHFE